MDFKDGAYAAKFRDIIRKIAGDEIDTQRPKYRYGTVTTFDRTTRKCTVTFPGGVTAVPVSMGSIQPSAIGQIVRVGGIGADRFIEDVMGLAYSPYAPETAWTLLTLNSPWVNYDSTGSFWPRATYRKDGDGFVHLRGLLQGGTGITPSAVCNIPAGYRPLKAEIFTVYTNNGAARVDIGATGDITWVGGGTPDNYLSFSSITYLAGA